MCERRDQEAAGTACGIQDAIVLFWAKDLDDELDWAPRCKVLAAIATKVGSNDFLIRSALGIDVGAREVVLGELRSDKCQRTWGERNLFVPSKKSLYTRASPH
jgi:hypothetical protein